LEKELDEATKAELHVKDALQALKTENKDFLQGQDADLSDEIAKLMTELNEVKDEI